MALQLNVQSIPLMQGIDTKTDPKQLKLGKLVNIQNLEFDEIGDLSPRNGYLALTQSIVNTGTISVGLNLATLNSSLVLADGSNLYSYVESLTKWAPKGQKIAVSLSVFPVTGAATNATVQDSARHSGGAAIYTWIDSQAHTMSYSVLDTNTQATIVQQGGGYGVALNAKPCVISSNSSFTIFVQETTNIKYTSVTLANPASSTALSANLFSTSATVPFDACTGSVYAYIFVQNGTPRLARVDATNTVVDSFAIGGETADSLTCWYDTTSNYVWLAWFSGSAVKYAVYTSAMVQVLAPTTLVAATGVTRLTGALTSGTTSTIYFETAGTVDADNYTRIYTATSAGVGTSISQIRSLGLAGKAFTYGGVTYAITDHSSEQQSTYFLTRPTGFNSYAQGTVIGKLAPLSGGGAPAIKTCGFTYAVASGKYAFAYLVQANATTIDGEIQSTKTIQSAIFDFTGSIRKQVLANNLHLGGALVTSYDSGSSTEHSFNLFPEGGSQFTPTPLGGIAPGTYSYKFTYEWIDEFGQTNRSAPSTGLEANISSLAGITANDGVSTTRISMTIGGDSTNSSRYIYVGVALTDILTIYAANTRITAIVDANEVDLTPADAGGTFSTPTQFTSRKTFSVTPRYSENYTLNTAIVSNPTVLSVNSSMTSGSTQVFVAVTGGLVVGQAITDNVGAIPGATTISSFVYKNGGALLTLSAAATATYTDAIVNITHATGWPINNWLHVGQAITGSGIPASTTITEIGEYLPGINSTLITVSNDFTVGVTTITATIQDFYTSKLTLPTLRVTEKGRVTSPVQIAVWRTEDGGTSYYKTGYAINDTTVDSVTYYDYASDDELVGNTPLYTNGGEVENISAPASDFMTSYKNRIILLPSEDGYSWWYSKQVVNGTPVEFSDLFTQSIDQRGGPLTGASPLDDKLVFFKQKDIFYIVGDGPAPSGANNDFSYPQIVTSPCGCTEPKSIITIPTGIVFKSAKGFYLLDRGLNVSYIGAEVEDYNSYTVTSAVLTATNTQVRFTMSGGITLVYDYYVQQWSVFTNITAVDSVIYGNTFAYLTAAGAVNQETPGAYSDNGSVITSSFRTGWISFDKVQNFQRLWTTMILGRYYSPHTLNFAIAQNFNSVPTQSASITTSSTITPFQYKFPTIRQKCEAAQLFFECVPSSIAGQGMTFASLVFEFGIKKGSYKLPASRTEGGSRA